MNQDLIRTNAKKAIAVFGFLSSIPNQLQKHVFYHIIEDAFAQSVFLTPHEATKELVTAVGAHIYFKKQEDVLLRHIFPNSTDEIVSALQKGEYDSSTDGLGLYLPEKRLMNDAFPYFKWNGDGKLDFSNMTTEVEELIKKHFDEQKPYYDEKNAFEKLGFLTLMMNVNKHLKYSEHATKYRSLFFKWYCDGQILDVVFDTITKSQITSVKRELLDYITERCLKDRRLFEVVNITWNEYRTFYNMIANKITFKTEDTRVDDDAIERVKPLGLPDKDIYERMTQSDNYGFRCFYTYLVQNQILNRDETEDIDFINIFSDEKKNKTIKRVAFHLKYKYNVNDLFHFIWQWYTEHCHINGEKKTDFFVRFKDCLKLLVLREGKEEEKNWDTKHLNPIPGNKVLYDGLLACQKSIPKNYK